MRIASVLCAVLLAAAAAATEIPIDTPYPVPVDASQDLPRIAAGDGGYLIVWRDYRSQGDVYAARLDRDRNLLDPTGIRISRGQGAPSVIAVPGGYLVAITDCPPRFVFVSQSGEVSQPNAFDWGRCPGGYVELATNGETVLATAGGVGALLDLHGTVIHAISIATTARMSAVASDGRNYLVAIVQSVIDTTVSVFEISRLGTVVSGRVVRQIHQADGISIASDGTNYLLAIASITITLHHLDSTGQAIGDVREMVTPGLLSVAPRLAWNGSLYGLAYATHTPVSPAQFAFCRLRADGDFVPPVATGPEVGQTQFSASFDVAPASSDFLVVWERNHRVEATLASAAALDRGVLSADFGVARAAAEQLGAVVTRVDNGFVALWVEPGLSSRNLKARSVAADGTPHGEAVVVTSLSSLGWPGSYAAAYDGTSIVIVWIDHGVRLRRLTRALQAVDPEPMIVAPEAARVSMASAKGVTVIAWDGAGYIWGDIGVAVIDTEAMRRVGTNLTMPRKSYADHHPAVGFNGIDFVVMWAHQTGPPPTQGLFPDPPDDILAVRVTRSAAIIEAAPVTVAHLQLPVASLDTASSERELYVVWLTDTYARPGPAAVFGILLHPDLTVAAAVQRISESDAVALSVSITSAGREFLVAWRSLIDRVFARSSVIVRVVDESGQPAWIERFGPTETLTYWIRTAIAASDAGLFVVYDRIDDSEESGGVSRVFVRRAAPAPPRRRSVRTH